MFKVDCSEVPQSVSDYAFDHIQDDVENSEALSLDYDSQVVHIDTGNMKFASEVKEAITDRAMEKVNDLEFETKQDYGTGFKVNVIQNVKSEIAQGAITLESE